MKKLNVKLMVSGSSTQCVQSGNHQFCNRLYLHFLNHLDIPQFLPAWGASFSGDKLFLGFYP